jgi:hypothetical protein
MFIWFNLLRLINKQHDFFKVGELDSKKIKPALFIFLAKTFLNFKLIHFTYSFVKILVELIIESNYESKFLMIFDNIV